MKYAYQIEINRPSSRGVTIEYRYGSIRGIALSIGRRGASIRFETNSLHDPVQMLTENDSMVMDAVKKACLLFTLVNDMSLTIRSIIIRKNGETVHTEAFDNAHPLVYSMLCGGPGIQGSGLDDPALLKQIANTPKSKTSRADTALMSFLVAKTRTYRIERFIYLWMCMNSVYALAAECAEGSMKSKNGKDIANPKEKDCLRLLAAMYGMEYPDIRKENEIQMMRHAFSLAKHKDIHECLLILEKTLHGAQTRADHTERYEVRAEVFEEYDLLALMLFWLPYRLRCHYFHSENAIPVFCYEDEKLLQGLSFVNALLEHFLSMELAAWVTHEKRKMRLLKRAQETAAGMVFGN